MVDLWTPDESTRRLWPKLIPGTAVLVEKRDEFGDNGPTYPAVVAESPVPEPWVEIHATWTMKDINVGGVPFRVGDTMREFFSPRHPYNAFAIVSPGGELRGWYCNVTRPAKCEDHGGTLLIAWPDLILDAIMQPDGTITNLDEDELAESGLPDRNPNLALQIFGARDELTRLLKEGFFPAG